MQLVTTPFSISKLFSPVLRSTAPVKYWSGSAKAEAWKKVPVSVLRSKSARSAAIRRVDWSSTTSPSASTVIESR